MTTEEKILSLLHERPGLRSAEIATVLGEDKRVVARLLFGPLASQLRQESSRQASAKCDPSDHLNRSSR